MLSLFYFSRWRGTNRHPIILRCATARALSHGLCFFCVAPRLAYGECSLLERLFLEGSPYSASFSFAHASLYASSAARRSFATLTPSAFGRQ